MSRWLRLSSLLLAAGGCFLVNSNDLTITYDLDPQEFAQDFGATTGVVPAIDCSANAQVCAQLPAPAGTTAVCDAATKQCALQADVRLTQTINLAAQKSFPSQVASSSVVSSVQVNAVHYWTASNTLTVATPPFDLYLGPQTMQLETDPGAVLLGSVPSLAAMTLTSCAAGTPGTQASECSVPLTDAGKGALGTLAADFRTPFNVLVVAHLVVQAGQPMPAGRIDLFVQPTLAYVLPLK